MSSALTKQLNSLKYRIVQAYNVEPNKYDRKGMFLPKNRFWKVCWISDFHFILHPTSLALQDDTTLSTRPYATY